MHKLLDLVRSAIKEVRRVSEKRYQRRRFYKAVDEYYENLGRADDEGARR